MLFVLDMMYIAPEILRMSARNRPLYGTKEGDVYSFAIILQEAVLVSQPYAIDLHQFSGEGQLRVTSSSKLFIFSSIRQIFFSSKSSLLIANLQYELIVQVQSGHKRGNPMERNVSLAGSPRFTLSLRCITNKVVSTNT